MPFPKPLAPIITRDGIIPIYHHVLGHLREVANPIYAVVSSEADPCLLRSLVGAGVKTAVKPGIGEICSSFAHGAEHIARIHGRDTLVAVALPDSIWELDPGSSMHDVVRAVRGDGALALFLSGRDELDEVIMDGLAVRSVTTKVKGVAGTVRGWGAFVIRAGALANFNDAEKDGPQLGRLDMGWSQIGSYHDLGSPERYITWHDLRARE
jgi:hypothetical protein